MIVLDTNVVSEIWHIRSHPGVVRWLREQDPSDLFLCMPVVAELSYGGNRILVRDKSERYLRSLKDMIGVGYRDRILPFDEAAALRFGAVVAQREAIGRPIGPMDAQIAAICLVHGATLATRNVRDFDGLDLRLINPFETAPEQ